MRGMRRGLCANNPSSTSSKGTVFWERGPAAHRLIDAQSARYQTHCRFISRTAFAAVQFYYYPHGVSRGFHSRLMDAA